jgi:hypothetical protein
MALTVTLDQRFPHKPQGEGLGILTGTITFDSSYLTDGESATGISKYFKDLYTIMFDCAAGYNCSYDRTANTVKVYAPVDVVAGTGTAATNNFVFKNTVLEVDGTGTAFQQPGVQVASTTDLSAVTCSFVAFGRY